MSNKVIDWIIGALIVIGLSVLGAWLDRPL